MQAYCPTVYSHFNSIKPNYGLRLLLLKQLSVCSRNSLIEQSCFFGIVQRPAALSIIF